MIAKKVDAIAAALMGALLLVCDRTQAAEVKLTVSEPDGVARAPAVVTTGVPFSKGAVTDVSKLATLVGGKAVPAQFLKTVPWDDGSIRWALLDVQVPVAANGKVEMVVSDAAANPAPATPVTVSDSAASVSVDTGPLQFTVSKTKGGLFDSVVVDGKNVVKPSARGLVVVKEDGTEVVAGAPAEVKVESSGPMRTVVLVRGTFPDVHAGLLGYTARITAYAGRKILKVHFWLENRGSFGYYRARNSSEDDPVPPDTLKWLFFKGMAINLDLGLGDTVTAACEGVEAADHLTVSQLCTPKTKDANREPVYLFTDLNFTVGSNSNVLKKGDRTDGVVGLKGGGGQATVAVRDFWQNYEKAIELDGRTLKLWLWPVGGRYPRFEPTAYGAGLQYFDVRLDKTAAKTQKTVGYFLEGSVHKGHEVILDFSGRDAKESSAELSCPLVALASAEYYATTEALPGFVPPPEVRTSSKVCNIKLAAWLRMIQSSSDPTNATSICKGRETRAQSSVYWHGWMDLGDICTGAYASPAGDWPWLLLSNGLRTGDMNNLRLASEMARHRIDVDTLWSEQELSDIRGLARNGNFLALHCGRLRWLPEPGDIGIPGLALDYMITGEPKARECALLGGQGLKANGAHSRHNVGQSAGMMQADCALYDLTADKAWLDDALGLFNAEIVPVWKAKGPFLHDPNDQIRSQDYVKEDAAYFDNIPAFCELHRLTGNETVLKMLKEACEQPCPESYDDAPLRVASLYAYVALVTNDDALFDRAMESFVRGFPLSKSPPVFLVNNAVWPARASGLMRSGNILQYAAWKKGQGK